MLEEPGDASGAPRGPFDSRMRTCSTHEAGAVTSQKPKRSINPAGNLLVRLVLLKDSQSPQSQEHAKLGETHRRRRAKAHGELRKLTRLLKMTEEKRPAAMG